MIHEWVGFKIAFQLVGRSREYGYLDSVGQFGIVYRRIVSIPGEQERLADPLFVPWVRIEWLAQSE